MGGSFSKAIIKLPMIKKIIGFDHNKDHEKEALALGLVDEVVSFDEIKKTDIIILAIPVDGIIACLKDLQGVPKTTTIIEETAPAPQAKMSPMEASEKLRRIQTSGRPTARQEAQDFLAQIKGSMING
jgi:prephenate dehydrogenase